MTAVAYSDLITRSPDNRYTLAARSPHNGTIAHRDGRQATDGEYGFRYRQEQSDFRYRLTETATGRVLLGR